MPPFLVQLALLAVAGLLLTTLGEALVSVGIVMMGAAATLALALLFFRSRT